MSNSEIVKRFNDKIHKRYHYAVASKEADRTEEENKQTDEKAKYIRQYESKMSFAKHLHNHNKLNNKQFSLAHDGWKGELAKNLASENVLNVQEPDASDLDDAVNNEMGYLRCKTGSQNGTQMSHTLDKYYQRYTKQHAKSQQRADSLFIKNKFGAKDLTPKDKFYVLAFHHAYRDNKLKSDERNGYHDMQYRRVAVLSNAESTAKQKYQQSFGTKYKNDDIMHRLNPNHASTKDIERHKELQQRVQQLRLQRIMQKKQKRAEANDNAAQDDNQKVFSKADSADNAEQQNNSQSHDRKDEENMYNNTSQMDQQAHNNEVRRDFQHYYHTDPNFHNQANLYMEDQKNRQLHPTITPTISNELVKLNNGSMTTRQTRSIYKDYSNQMSLSDYRGALVNYLDAKESGISTTHVPGETDVNPERHRYQAPPFYKNVISNEIQNAQMVRSRRNQRNAQYSQEEQPNRDNEFYVKHAQYDPYWSKKLHRPFVKMDAVHRTDINPNSKLAGHYVTSYIDKQGHMHHAQIIPGQLFNNILRMNGRQPYTVGDYVRSIGHNIANSATRLVFRARTFVSRGLNKIRGKASHFINVASIKASRFKLNLHRELILEQRRRQRAMRYRKMKVVSNCKHPLDAFNFVSPREMKQMFGTDPRNYHWKQDFEETRKPNSIFNRFTPDHLDKVNGPSWRPGFNANRGFGRQTGNQGFEMQ